MIATNKIGSVVHDRRRETVRAGGNKKIYLIGAIALIALFLVFRFFVGGKTETAAPPPRPVAVATVISRDVPLYLDEIGTCAAFETVQVQAQVSGQIVGRHFKDGQDVKKGDLLFSIDPRPYQASLDSAKADLLLAQQNLQRQETLKAKGVIATQDLETARSTEMRDQALVDAAQVNLDFTQIRSPIDGRAGLHQVDVGNTVAPGTNSAILVTIDNLDPIYTDFTIAEPDIPLVRRYLGGSDLKVLTDAAGDKYPPRAGSLHFLADTVQAGTGTVQARAVTPNADRALWPQQFVHVRLILEQLKNALLVPNGAVQTGQRGPYLFVVKTDSTLDLRQVVPGQRHGELTVIKKGVKAGERVVTRGQLQLAPGTRVVVQETEKTATDLGDQSLFDESPANSNSAE